MTTFILFFTLLSTNLMHVGQMAEYYFSVENNELQMKFVIEKDELFSFEFNGNCEISKTTAICVTNYIQSNFDIKVNGEKYKMELSNSYTEKGHFIAFFTANLKDSKVNEIQMSNHCFYEFYSAYKNRIIINIDGFEKSYLLTKKNDSIHLI